ncbi:Serpin I2 [Thelohanellus kitauei]|uniref:Serpin I2 n=1 Tax=Thelohanellus kitauei TaxID=669202 RepID=A0A0C2IIT2_THEKT|nr:Serpin I2 [Thelohanellus kitauei]
MIFKPYTQEEMYAIIILPNDGFSIQDVLYNFKVDQIANYFKKSHFEYVHLKLPKFKLFHDIDLVETLKKFGITYIFDRNMSDFGSMTNESVYIGNLIQVANLEVSESADSNYKYDISMTSELIDDSYEFFVTNPFLFLVYSYTENVMLISAILTNPSLM